MCRSSGTYVTEELPLQLFFWMFISSSSSRDCWHWLWRFTANLPMLAATLTLNLIIHPVWKEKLFGACVAEPHSYAKKEDLFNENVTAAVCNTKHTLTSLLIRTMLETNLWEQVQCIFEWIPCKCGRSYTGEMGRLLAMQVQKYRHNVLEGLVPQHANEGRKIGWNEARILQIEIERYRKNK